MTERQAKFRVAENYCFRGIDSVRKREREREREKERDRERERERERE